MEGTLQSLTSSLVSSTLSVSKDILPNKFPSFLFKDAVCDANNAQGTVVAIARSDKSIQVWDLPTETLISTLKGHKSFVNVLGFSAGGPTRTPVGARTLVPLSPRSSSSTSSAPHLREEYLASGSYDYTIRIWDYRQETCLLILMGHTSWVETLSFDSQGDRLVSGAGNSEAILWDISSSLKSTSQETRNDPETMEAPQEATRDPIVVKDSFVQLGKFESCVLSVAFHPTEPVVAIGTGSGKVHLRSFDPKKPADPSPNLLTWSMETPLHTSKVLSLKFAPLGGKLLVSGSEDKTAIVWQYCSLKLVPLRRCAEHAGPVAFCEISPDDAWLFTGSIDRTLRIWSLANLTHEEAPLHQLDLGGIQLLSPRGSTGTSHINSEQRLRLLELENDKLKSQLRILSDSQDNLLRSKVGEIVASQIR